MSNGYKPEGDTAVKERPAAKKKAPAKKAAVVKAEPVAEVVQPVPESEASPARARPSRQAEEKQERRRRSDMSLGRLAPLEIDESLKDPDYVYRWVNDDPGRIRQLSTHDDYDIVTEDMLGQRSDKDRGAGSNVERVADKSTGRRTILMRKRRDYYEKDQADKEKLNQEIDDVIRQGGSQSAEGLSGANAYIPEGGISLSRRD